MVANGEEPMGPSRHVRSLSRGASGARQATSAVPSVALLLLLQLSCFRATLTSSASNADPKKSQEMPRTEDVGAYLADGSNWQWPQAEADPEQNGLFNVLTSWCGDTYTDALADANQKAGQFVRLREERDHHYKEWMQCTLEKATQEQELNRECVKQQLLHNSSFVRERTLLQAEFDREQAQLRADLEACDLRHKRRVDAACDRDAAAAQATCVEESAQLAAKLQACEGKAKSAESGRCASLELGAMRMEEERKAWAEERARLGVDVAECRPAKAQAEARLKGVLADGTIASLESTVTWLQVLLLVMLLLLMGASAAALFLFFQEGGRVGASRPVGWALTQPPAKLRLLTAEQAQDELQAAYEGGEQQGVSIILTTTAEGEAGPALVFLLVPVNVASSRRFALFGGGGDYTGYVERAQEFVSKVAPKARLVLLLYEYGGCVFTDTTLQSLRLTADKVADEAAPKDADFPKRHDIVVLWLHRPEGLCAADCEGESELSAAIKAQPWAQYLLSRSGRWGPLPAQ